MVIFLQINGLLKKKKNTKQVYFLSLNQMYINYHKINNKSKQTNI